MAKGKAHSDEVKAQVLAALLAGQGITEVAEQYNLPMGTVGNWKAEIDHGRLEEVRRKKGEQLDDLLFGYVTAVLETLKRQAEVVGEAKYIRSQDAHSLAVLHGVMADKSIRILEAAERAGGLGDTARPA